MLPEPIPHEPRDSAPHVCLGCGCLCDDIVWHPDRTVPGVNACPLGNEWYRTPVSEMPLASIEGSPATLDEAIQRGRQILADARHPLITGFNSGTSECQRAACRLADLWGGVFDSTLSVADADTTISFQNTGAVTGTWGEIAQRADTLLLWASDPPTTHPRMLERYALEPTSPWLPGGSRDRQVIVVDDQANSCAGRAEIAIRISKGRHYEALSTLRMALGQVAADESSVLASTGVEWSQWVRLAERLKQARFGGVVYGKRIATGFGEGAAALTHCLVNINKDTRWIGLADGGGGNPGGGITVATWQTGFPLGVRLSAGFPEYGPHEWLTPVLLVRQEVDAAIIVGDNLLERLPSAARDTLKSIPTLVLHWHDSPTSEMATVRIRVARPVEELGGTVYRADGLSLPLRPVHATRYPDPRGILEQLCPSE